MNANDEMTTTASGGGVDSVAKVIEEMRRVESNPRESHVLAAIVGAWADRLSALSRGEPVAWLVDAEFVDAGKIRTVSISKPFASSWPSGSTFTPLYLHPSAARGVDEWLPIESAPKSVVDGRHVAGIYLLGFVPDDEFDPSSCIDIVWWEPLLTNRAGTRGKWCRSAGSTDVECKPTHWRPLPAPPALETPNV